MHQEKRPGSTAKVVSLQKSEYADYPIDKVWILGRLADAATSHSGALGSYVRSYLATTTVLVGRCGDILPVPLLKSNEFKPTGWTHYRWKVLQQFVGVVLSGLSFIYSVNLERGLPVSFNASQKVVCVRLIDKTVNLIHRLQGADESEVLRGLPRWYDDPTAKWCHSVPDLRCETDDSPDVAASVVPDKWMPVEARAIVSKPAELFREAPPDLSRFGGIAESDRSEYVKHTANLLRCGKLRLSGYAHAGGTVFVVGKPKLGSDGLRRLREVWHGTRVSNAAVAPPKPPHLADVTSLTHLQLQKDELLRVSKRDAQCWHCRSWFDNIVCPSCREKHGSQWDEMSHRQNR